MWQARHCGISYPDLVEIIIEDALVGNYRNVRLLDPRTYGVQVEYKF